MKSLMYLRYPRYPRYLWYQVYIHNYKHHRLQSEMLSFCVEGQGKGLTSSPHPGPATLMSLNSAP